MKKTHNNHLRALALCLLLAALIPFAASCKKKPEPAPSTDTTEGGLYTADYLPGLDCNGYEFRIVDIDNHPQTIEGEPVTIVDNAIYKRNEVVKARYNIDIKANTYELEYWWKIPDLVAQLANAESADYDLITHRFMYAYADIINGNMVAACDLPKEYVDMSRPWHKQSINEGLTVGGVAIMDCTAFDIQPGGDCVFFNKDLVAELNLEDPYALVDAGAWTYDAMWQMARAAASEDYDRESGWSEDDRYGFFANWHEMSDLAIGGTGRKLINIENGTPALNKTEGFVNVLISASEALSPDGMVFDIYEAWGMLEASKTRAIQMFANGQCMFVIKETDKLTLLGDMEDDYGVLPYPKENAEQERYYVPISGYVAQPLSCHPNLNAVCIIKEALAVETLNYYDPAYYENTIQNRYLRSEEDLKYLKLITDSATSDLGLQIWWSELRNPLAEDVLAQHGNGFASKLEAITPKAQVLIDTLMEFVNSKK